MANYEQQPRDLGTQGKADTLAGKFKHMTGKVQRKAGQMMGNHSMQAKGAAREAGGSVQAAGGKVEQKVDQALNPDKNTGTSASTPRSDQNV